MGADFKPTVVNTIKAIKSGTAILLELTPATP
jgi:hypothetical protein